MQFIGRENITLITAFQISFICDDLRDLVPFIQFKQRKHQNTNDLDEVKTQ